MYSTWKTAPLLLALAACDPPAAPPPLPPPPAPPSAPPSAAAAPSAAPTATATKPEPKAPEAAGATPAKEGEMCGGFAGIPCEKGLVCGNVMPVADGSGTCRKGTK